jgi:hypothetical protein
MQVIVVGAQMFLIEGGLTEEEREIAFAEGFEQGFNYRERVGELNEILKDNVSSM